MPARDLFHQPFRNALEKDGWRITHDPHVVRFDRHDFNIDLSAEKAGRKIAIEIQDAVGAFEVEDLAKALGEFILYRSVLATQEPDRVLYLAVQDVTFHEGFGEQMGSMLIEELGLGLIVYNERSEKILSWSNEPAATSDPVPVPVLTEAELQRRESLPNGRTLAEILADLEERYRRIPKCE